MAGCLAARTAKSRDNEPPPSFAWGDPSVITPVRTLFPRGCLGAAYSSKPRSQKVPWFYKRHGAPPAACALPGPARVQAPPHTPPD